MYVFVANTTTRICIWVSCQLSFCRFLRLAECRGHIMGMDKCKIGGYREIKLAIFDAATVVYWSPHWTFPIQWSLVGYDLPTWQLAHRPCPPSSINGYTTVSRITRGGVECGYSHVVSHVGAAKKSRTNDPRASRSLSWRPSRRQWHERAIAWPAPLASLITHHSWCLPVYPSCCCCHVC